VFELYASGELTLPRKQKPRAELQFRSSEIGKNYVGGPGRVADTLTACSKEIMTARNKPSKLIEEENLPSDFL
jgi:hypothetical protein